MIKYHPTAKVYVVVVVYNKLFAQEEQHNNGDEEDESYDYDGNTSYLF